MFSIPILATTWACSEVTRPEPQIDVVAGPLEPAGAAMLLGDPWQTEGFCVSGDADPSQAPSGFGVSGFWVYCECPIGMDPLAGTATIDFDANTSSGPTCVCANGSSQEDCVAEGSGGGGDPPDPGGPGSGPPPSDTVRFSLLCNESVVRGAVGGCEISVSPATAQVADVEWEALVFDASPEQQGGMSWSGTMVTPTEVRVTATVSGSGLSVQHASRILEIDVTPRSGAAWDWSNSWNFMPNGLPGGQSFLLAASPFTVQQATGPGLTLGIWCRNLACDGSVGFLRPDPAAGEPDAHVIGSVTSGPNEGLHFVGSAGFFSETANAIHPDLYPTSGNVFSGMATCNNMNWWDANVCGGVPSSSLQELLTGVINHEAFGSTGSNGHESVARIIAAQYDPFQAVEGLVLADEALLRSTVGDVILDLRNSIQNGINQSAHPSGNFGPRLVYLRDGSTWQGMTLGGDGS